MISWQKKGLKKPYQVPKSFKFYISVNIKELSLHVTVGLALFVIVKAKSGRLAYSIILSVFSEGP